MKPRRYPYSGKKEHTSMKVDNEIKVDNEKVEKLLRNTSCFESLQKEVKICTK